MNFNGVYDCLKIDVRERGEGGFDVFILCISAGSAAAAAGVVDGFATISARPDAAGRISRTT